MNEELELVQFQKPPLWIEVLSYAGMVGLFAGAFTGNVGALCLLAGWALFWNYKLFESIKAYVEYVNATEINNLLARIVEDELNKQKDGTFQDNESLTKEKDDVEGQNE